LYPRGLLQHQYDNTQMRHPDKHNALFQTRAAYLIIIIIYYLLNTNLFNSSDLNWQ
jgi:hypothetical protein